MSDVDVFVQLRPRHFDRAAQDAVMAIATERIPAMVDRIYWPQNEVRLVLNAGSRILPFVDAIPEALLAKSYSRRKIEHSGRSVARWSPAEKNLFPPVIGRVPSLTPQVFIRELDDAPGSNPFSLQRSCVRGT